MPAVVFRVAVLAQALAAGTFEPQRRRVEKRDRNSAEQRLAMAVERLLDSLGGVAARRVDRSEPGHRLVGMVEIEPFSARHAPPAEPVVSMAVGARDHQPVQHLRVSKSALLKTAEVGSNIVANPQQVRREERVGNIHPQSAPCPPTARVLGEGRATELAVNKDT